MMVSYPNVLCLLEGVKTGMKPVGFREDQIPILMKMKIMKGRDEKEVRELFMSLYYTVTVAMQKLLSGEADSSQILCEKPPFYVSSRYLF